MHPSLIEILLPWAFLLWTLAMAFSALVSLVFRPILWFIVWLVIVLGLTILSVVFPS